MKGRSAENHQLLSAGPLRAPTDTTVPAQPALAPRSPAHSPGPHYSPARGHQSEKVQIKVTLLEVTYLHQNSDRGSCGNNFKYLKY